MGGIKVEKISKEMIKPSSPTPLHLRNLPLSFIDQMQAHIHPFFTFYYPIHLPNPNIGEISTLLKRSLSHTLVYYYPLAGRIEGNNVSITCNDEGVEYNEAYVSTELLKIVENPNIDELRVLLPFGPTDRERIVLGIQVNHFSCGGIAVSICISHKIADAKAFIDFANAWAKVTHAIVAGNSLDGVITNPPRFNGASYFPPMDFKGTYTPAPRTSDDKFVTTRFVFDKYMMEGLKKKAVDEGIDFHPTSVEAVTAFIWKCVMEAYEANPAPGGTGTKIWVAFIPVDLRTRAAPNIPEDCFGNISWVAIAPSLTGVDAKHSELANMVRGAIQSVNSHFIDKALQHGEYGMKILKSFQTLKSNDLLDVCKFSSLCRLPIYEVDFGWGKPIWVGQTIMPFNNMVLYSKTSCGQGIEAWVSLASHQHLSLLQHRIRLLQITSKELSTSEKFSRSAL